MRLEGEADRDLEGWYGAVDRTGPRGAAAGGTTRLTEDARHSGQLVELAKEPDDGVGRELLAVSRGEQLQQAFVAATAPGRHERASHQGRRVGSRFIRSR
jgi:hypothetical protein